MANIESLAQKPVERLDLSTGPDELRDLKELPKDIESGKKQVIDSPDMSFIDRFSRSALMEQCSIKTSETGELDEATNSEVPEIKSEGLAEAEKVKIKEEQGWSDEIIDNIQNMKQYENLKNAGLIEAEINDRICLIKENIDLEYTGEDEDDENKITNRERIARGVAPLDSKTGKPIELHHLGQNADSPLVELTEEEHRTGEYEDGKKNQSLWHDNTRETEVHGEGTSWNQERKLHWKARAENMKG